ncbi:MAG: A/G-specific adenine glycosylase [Bacteroidota bacterium]|nr:A/G-specific adenine glycosylase [Bacteroidota bacterium]
MIFEEEITRWYKLNKRDLPWRKTRDPYLIWLSEIILQQTRVNQGLSYYEKFSEKYPTVQDLANEKEEEVLKLWQGLGYYSRARNMHFTAKYIVENLNGKFPSSYDEILKLKGVGEYTAAAVASFSFNEKKAVLDGNVFRLLSRYFGIHLPIDSSAGKKEFKSLANDLILEKEPGTYNQAIMEYGALVCTPKVPSCKSCRLSINCEALSKNEVDILPLKSKKINKRDRFFNFLVITDGESAYLQQRLEKDIWIRLFQFPLLETEQEISSIENNSLIDSKHYLVNVSDHKHLLSHQTIYAKFWLFKSEISLPQNSKFKIVSISEIHNYAVPKLIENYLNEFFQLIN